LTFTEEKQRIDAIRYLIHRKYPRENFGVETTLFRLGNAGRNSFRTDFAVYDQPFDSLRGLSLEKRLDHLRLLAEIKRDNVSAEAAKANQVRSALHLVPDMDALGVYWDDIEQRFFFRQIEKKKSVIKEAPISKIPTWGSSVDSTKLSFDDLAPTKDLVRIFDEIEDAIHTHLADKAARYTLIQQLLLQKIFDENSHRAGKKRSDPLDIQDYSVEALTDADVMRRMNDSLSRAASHYNIYLPPGKLIDDIYRCHPEVIRQATKILAPINVLGSKTSVIQQFYMKFAKSLYKWDLAQYFTPHEVIDFIVDLTNPQPGEHVYDPACGSADFLVSAFRRVGTPADSCVWGADHSEQAVQISILNMVLNGDGKTQIKPQDSLVAFGKSSQLFPIVLCNPPFGTKIVERRYEVLRKFDVAHVWKASDRGLTKTDEVREAQQAGIVFAELCVRLCTVGGRVGIILPNGYLGNRGTEYVALREWLLRHTRIVGIFSFPRFTFKKSGADVSASAVVLEKRAVPLANASESEDYSFFVGNIESVGWRAGDKSAGPIYLREASTGEPLLDDNNEPILDADFDRVLSDFIQSPAIDCFPWAADGREPPPGVHTEGISIKRILSRADRNLDPKRYAEKFARIQASIASGKHFRLGDVLEIAPPSRLRIERSKLYRYVEIERVGIGEYDNEQKMGWDLPSRAKLAAAPGDIFIAHIWSSAGKWFIAAGDCSNVVVTNGCTRLRFKRGCEDRLADLAVGLSSEAFRIQMRGLATGSDGLAEIVDEDILSIILPNTLTDKAREAVMVRLEPILSGSDTFQKFAQDVQNKSTSFPSAPPRKHHWSLI